MPNQRTVATNRCEYALQETLVVVVRLARQCDVECRLQLVADLAGGQLLEREFSRLGETLRGKVRAHVIGLGCQALLNESIGETLDEPVPVGVHTAADA